MLHLAHHLAELASDRKLVSSRGLNYLGAQVARILVARAMYRVKRASVPDSLRVSARALAEDGVLVCPEFLPRDDFARICGEFSTVLDRWGNAFRCSPYSPCSRKLSVRKIERSSVPGISAFLEQAVLRLLLEAVEKQSWRAVFRSASLEMVSWGASPEEDPQTTPHSDVFFHSHKAWLYLTDVGLDDGCLAVVKKSHKLSRHALLASYRHSLSPGEDPSRRVTIDELSQLGLTESPLTCQRNTLIVVNTSAIHRRLPGKPGHTRRALQVCTRGNPFRIFSR